MGFRFFKRVSVLPGVGLNFGTHGGSVSIGPPGFKLTFSPHGVRASVGLPGTGLYYTFYPLSGKSAGRGDAAPPTLPQRPAPPVGTPSYQQDVTPTAPAVPIPRPAVEPPPLIVVQPVSAKKEESQITALEDAFAQYQAGKKDVAMHRFLELADDPSALFAAAAIQLEKNGLDMALECAGKSHDLVESQGRLADARLTVTVAITEELSLDIPPTNEGIALLTAEILQRMDKLDKAIEILRFLINQDQGNVIVKLSLAELLYDSSTDGTNMEEIIDLARRQEPTDLAAICLLLYKARALYRLRNHEPVIPMITAILDAGDEMPKELLLALRYQLGLSFEALGRKVEARKQFEAIHAEEPGNEDVAKRIKQNR